MTDKKLMEKMRKDAEKFKELYHNRQYVRAINLYHRVHTVAVYNELPQENLDELFGSYIEDEDTEVMHGLFLKETVLRVADAAMKQELEENRRGNPTQVHDFMHYLPQSRMKEPAH